MAKSKIDRVLALHQPAAIRAAGGIEPWSKQLEAAWQALGVPEATALATRVLGDDDDRRNEILKRVACRLPAALEPIYERLVQKEIFYPTEIYRGAPEEIRDRLLGRIARAGELTRHHLVQCLAWIGDGGVQEAFAGWRAKVPRWGRSWPLPPSDYALVAGWELTRQGERRELCSPRSIPLAKSKAASARVSVGRKTRLRNPWLDEPLYELLDVPGDRSPLGWLGRPEQPLAVLTCFSTVNYVPVFCDLSARGQARWSRHNKRNRDVEPMGDGWAPFAPATLRPQAASSPWCGNEAFDGSTSKLGGFPIWVQDARYPVCPQCKRHMPFVAQLDAAELGGDDGVYYVFVCADDALAATTQQQM